MNSNYQTKRILTMLSISLFIVSVVFTVFVGQIYFGDMDRSAKASEFMVRDNVIKSNRSLDEWVEIEIRADDEQQTLINQLLSLEENQLLIPVEIASRDIQQTAAVIQDVILNNTSLKVLGVLSGDLIVVEKIGIISLLGVNSPHKSIEFEECYYNESKAYLSENILDSIVTLKFDKAYGHVSQNGVAHAYVFDSNQGLVNSEIIKEGYAKSSEGAHLLKIPLDESQAIAVNFDLGLWASTGCGGGAFKQLNGGLQTLPEATNEVESTATLTIVDTRNQ